MLLWLSMVSKTGEASGGLACVIKCRIHCTNNSAVIHPVGDVTPFVPGGAFLIIKSLKYFPGNTRNESMELPIALMLPHMVTNVSFSLETISPTCFCPFWTNTLPVSCTVATAVFSTL